jgi:hypothetical protein
VSSVSTSPICARPRGTDVFKLAAKLGIDPMELLQMINGKNVPTGAVISGLAKELHSNVSLLTKLATPLKSSHETEQTQKPRSRPGDCPTSPSSPNRPSAPPPSLPWWPRSSSASRRGRKTKRGRVILDSPPLPSGCSVLSMSQVPGPLSRLRYPAAKNDSRPEAGSRGKGDMLQVLRPFSASESTVIFRTPAKSG